MSKRKIFNWLIVLLMALPLLTISCGGGGGGGNNAGGDVPPGDGAGNPPPGGGAAVVPPKPGVTIGVIRKGSVIVNGVTMTVSPTAIITVDDVAGKTEADLFDGMVVKVKGQFNVDGLTGVAEQIDAEDEVQGNVEAKDIVANTLTVLGQTIMVDANTVFPAGQSFAAITVGTPGDPLAVPPIPDIPGDMVEVHGLRIGAGVNGNVHATRIEVGKITVGGGNRAVGPTGANGFPTFYQDENGLALGLCLDPRNCLPDPVNPANPASVLAGFGDEAFWWSADALMDINAPIPNPPAAPLASGGALLVLALEAAWDGAGTPVTGQEISFSRLRIRIDVPVAGTYTVTHPYGVEVFEVATPGIRAINSEVGAPTSQTTGLLGDIGCLAPCDFSLALGGATFPFLIQQTPPPPPGFVGDLFEATVTGSPFGTNFFRIEGPAGSNLGGPGVDTIETNLFAVQGQIFSNIVEVKGVVGNLVGNTFTIGTQQVSFLAGTPIANGDRVEVKGILDSVTGILTASSIVVEAVEDAAFVPAEGQIMHVEGYIAGFTVHPGTFTVGMTPVSTSATTVFVGGVAADLANGKAVKAEGVMTVGVLVASEIEFKPIL